MTSVDEKLLKTRRDEREDDEEVPLAIVHVTTPSDEDDGDDDGFGSETEDEEVKMNTITGCRGIDDSDMNTTDDDDELSDDEELEQSERCVSGGFVTGSVWPRMCIADIVCLFFL